MEDQEIIELAMATRPEMGRKKCIEAIEREVSLDAEQVEEYGDQFFELAKLDLLRNKLTAEVHEATNGQFGLNPHAEMTTFIAILVEVLFPFPDSKRFELERRFKIEIVRQILAVKEQVEAAHRAAGLSVAKKNLIIPK